MPCNKVNGIENHFAISVNSLYACLLLACFTVYYSCHYHLNIVVNTLNQMGHLNQMAMQAQHQRIVDPRLQGIRGVYTPPVSGVAPRGMGGSPLMNRTLTPGKQGMIGLHFN